MLNNKKSVMPSTCEFVSLMEANVILNNPDILSKKEMNLVHKGQKSANKS